MRFATLVHNFIRKKKVLNLRNSTTIQELPKKLLKGVRQMDYQISDNFRQYRIYLNNYKQLAIIFLKRYETIAQIESVPS